jgi:hypothetical protein
VKPIVSSILWILLLSAAVSAEPDTTSTKGYGKDDMREILNAFAESEALRATMVLMDLRQGRTDRAMESLEYKIDLAVIGIWRQARLSKGAHRDRHLEVLGKIKAYRTKYPRRKMALLDKGPKEGSRDKVIASARDILSQLVLTKRPDKSKSDEKP